MVDPRERHFGPIIGDKEDAIADVGALVRRLLVFEDVTLESIRLREVRPLLNVFGFDGLMLLLESDCFRINLDTRTEGSIPPGLMPGGPPPGAYMISTVRWVPGADLSEFSEPEQTKYIDRALIRNVLLERTGAFGLSKKKNNRLASELEQRIVAHPRSADAVARESFAHELLEEQATLRRSLSGALKMLRVATDSGPTPDVLRVEQLSEQVFRVETNLSKLGVPEHQARKVTERALLSVASLEARIALMATYRATTGFRDEETPLLVTKLNSLSGLDPTRHEGTFDRVIEVAGLPTIGGPQQGTFVDAGKLLALRDDAEWREFRRWLREISDASPEEISERVNSASSTAAAILGGPRSKAVRFVAATGIGFVSAPAGLVLGVGNEFLQKELLNRAGPWAAVSRRYRSLFEF